jgi:hypothetical protein
LRIELDYRQSETGRPEGTLRVRGEPEVRPFVGTMQLLRLLEDLAEQDTSSRQPPSRSASSI